MHVDSALRSAATDRRGASVLLLMPDPYRGAGGIARYGRDLIDALAEMDGVSEIASVVRGPRGCDRNLPRKVVEYRASRRVSFVGRALRCALVSRPDLIVCGHVHYLGLASLLRRLSGRRSSGRRSSARRSSGRRECVGRAGGESVDERPDGAKIIALAYGIDVFTPRTRSTGAHLRQVDAIVAVSRYTRRRLLDWSGLDGDRVRVVGGAVRDTGAVEPGGAIDDRVSRDRVRRRLGFGENDAVLLTVGRMDARERYKGHDRLLDALPSVLSSRPDARMVFVGGGTDVPRLRARVERSGLGPSVRVLDEVPASELQDLYAGSDGFVMPSSKEGFGYVFLEALHAGLPVLAGDADGARDPLGDGARGVLVDPSNTEGVRRGVLELLHRARPESNGKAEPGFSRASGVPEAFRFPAFRRRWQALVETTLERS